MEAEKQKQKSDVIFLSMPCNKNRLVDGPGCLAFFKYHGYAGATVDRIPCFSLLCYNFNQSLADCWNKLKEYGLTYFVLCHADVVLDHGWLPALLTIMKQRDLQILSVLIPFTSGAGLTSTAVDAAPQPRRITMHEAHTMLPETFDGGDTLGSFGNGQLLFNTGVLLIRMEGFDPLACHFTIEDGLMKTGEQYQAWTKSEDWNFSRAVIRQGYRYAVTRAVQATHIGPQAFANDAVWGKEHDEQPS